MTLERLTAQVRAQGPHLATLGYRVQFDVEGEGAILIDGTVNPVVVSNDPDDDADCTISLSDTSLEMLLAGELNPTLAYTLGKIKVAGSLGVAMKLASILES